MTCLRTAAVFHLLILAACSQSKGDDPAADQAFVADPMKVATVHGTITAPGGDKIRILQLSSQSVFKVDPQKADGHLSKTFCRNGGNAVDPHKAPADPHADDGTLVHFNRALVDGDSFSVEVPVELGTGLVKCGYTRAEDTVLRFTALTETGVRFRFDVPLKIDSGISAGNARTELDVGDGNAPVAVKALDTEVSLTFGAWPDEPKKISGEVSFNEMWNKVVRTRRDDLPTELGASNEEIAASVLGNAAGTDARSLRVRRDQARVLMNDGEEKEEGVKAFHPFGACSKAEWRIDEDSGFSGLFRKGTNVNAILRFSAAGNNAKPEAVLGVHRLGAIAIKLFAGDPDAKTESLNIVTFDQNGPQGNPSPWFFNAADGNPTFFSNWIFGDSLVTHGNVKMFGHSVHDPQNEAEAGRLAPVTPVAVVQGDGSFVKASEMAPPRFVKLVPIRPKKDLNQSPETFGEIRDELIQYKDGDIELGIELFDNTAKDGKAMFNASKRVGVVTNVSQPIVSDYCDRTMQFHHAPQ